MQRARGSKVADDGIDLIRDQWTLRLYAGISAVGILYCEVVPRIFQQFPYEVTPSSSTVESVIPNGIGLGPLVSFCVACALVAELSHHKWARNCAKSIFSGCFFWTLRCLVVAICRM